MSNETTKINAVYVNSGICKGSGSDRYKTVTGITRKILAEIKQLETTHGPLSILVDSNTEYLGQQYKLVEIRGQYKNHRQIRDSDYQIVASI